jgi:hypothetical protein
MATSNGGPDVAKSRAICLLSGSEFGKASVRHGYSGISVSSSNDSEVNTNTSQNTFTASILSAFPPSLPRNIAKSPRTLASVLKKPIARGESQIVSVVPAKVPVLLQLPQNPAVNSLQGVRIDSRSVIPSVCPHTTG